MQPRARQSLSLISRYQQGASSVAGVSNPIKLSSNESPLGPSPKALEAYHGAAKELCRYPDGSQLALRTAIAEVHGIDVDRIVCGNGSDELIQLSIRAYVAPGDGVILSQHSFGMARTHALAQGALVSIAPEPDFQINVDEILSRVDARTRLVILASPTNPCGTYITGPDLTRLHAALPEQVLLLVDAAYADYVIAPAYDTGLAIARASPNVLVTRTFSKLYGLAALRIGWAYAATDIISNINKIRTPFNTNGPALAAAAAAVRDREHAARVRDHNLEWVSRVSNGLRAIGLRVVPSVANFVFIRFGEAPHDAISAHRFLLQHGIIPRPVGTDGPENCLRITIGLAHENEAVLAALTDFVRDDTGTKA